jgi:FkbM family methyltransferase
MNQYLNQLTTYGPKRSMRIIFDETARRLKQLLFRTYSQHSEDSTIGRLLGDKKKGLYVDIGAYDPFRFSNSHRFYLKGWRGINIEPDVNNYENFLKYRQRDININCGVGTSEKSVWFYNFIPSALSTFSKNDTDQYIKSGFKFIGKQKVPMKKLSSILSEHIKPNEKIDFMSIDVEGMELDVLKSNNWNKFRPLVVCIETMSSPGNSSQEYNKIHIFLKRVGYVKYCDIGLNSIFLDKFLGAKTADQFTALKSIIKPSLQAKLKSFRSIPSFLDSANIDSNKRYQIDIWSRKTYKVDPQNFVVTTIQERFSNCLIRQIKLPKNAVVVDIGCFIGEKLWQLKEKKNYLGVGVDISIPALKIAKEIDKFDNQFIAADLENLPFKNNSVDFIMAFDVIEHLTEPEKGFSEISRVLKPRGELLLHIPIKNNRFSLFWFKQKLLSKQAAKDYLDVGHILAKMLTTSQIKKYLKKYGLKLEKEIYYNSFFVHFFDRELLKIILWFMNFVRKEKDDLNHDLKNGKVGRLRKFYGKFVVPIFEVFSWPDKIFSRLKIGNTCFYLSSKV